MKDYLKGMIRRTEKRRFFLMLAGIVIMGWGIAFFRLSGTGADPWSSLMIAIGDRLGVDFSIINLICFCGCFAAEIKWGKELIGMGTFVNWFLATPLTTFYLQVPLRNWTEPTDFGHRMILMAAGVLVLSLAAALYQTADVGIAPYDSLSIMISQHKKWLYFPCRMLTDAISSLSAFLLGGVVGLGTLICALAMGPIVSFFSRYVATPILELQKKETPRSATEEMDALDEERTLAMLDPSDKNNLGTRFRK